MAGLLHVHSMYSINDCGSEPFKICERAKELGYNSVTLTDHGSLLGVIPFMESAKKANINAVPGIEAYLENKEHFVIIAKDYEGFKAISYANTKANENINTVPRMTKETIERYFKGNEHVIATTACIGGPISKILLAHIKWQRKKEKKLVPLQEIFESFKDFDTQYKKYKEQELTIKKQIKEFKPFVSVSYIKATEKPNNKLSKEEISLRLNNITNAKESIKLLEKQLTEVVENRKYYKKISDKLKPKKERYLTLVNDFKENEPKEDLYALAKKELEFYKSIFPNFYIELQYHGLEDEKYVMPLLVKLGGELNIPFIVGNDAHMVNKGEEEIRNLLRFNMFKSHMTIEEVDKTLYMKSTDELYNDILQVVDEDIAHKAIDNLSIIDECNVVFPKEKHYPSVKSELSFDELLEEERMEMIKKGEWNDEYENRLRREIDVIKSMGFVDYHMVVRDFCIMGRKLGLVPEDALNEIPLDFSKLDSWINKRGYRVGVGIGPGRGSAAGSLVCYMLHITNIDPIKYNLLFERFLNPERVTMPDIDTDVSKAVRPILIKYLQWRYGTSAICSITTEMTYGAKTAISLAGRDRASELYGNKKENEESKHNYMIMVNEIAALVGDDLGVKLEDISDKFNEKFADNEEAIHVYNQSKLIEGIISGTGIHAGGVVISDNDNINDYISVAWNDKKEVWAAQCDMNKLEEQGLIKMDLLGLQTLDIISNCLQLISQHKGKTITEFPFEEEVFTEIFAKGNTNCIFQFESGGMKNLLKQFKPTCFEDLILLNACYRPGPLQYIDGSNEINLIKRKNKEQKITYLVPELEPILKDTYGGIVYQESVMQIFKDLAGYSLGGADMVRRAMSKKKTEVLAKERKSFVYGDETRNIKGCVKNGIPEDKANKLFDDMTEFAKYAFNKSHSTAYAYVAYQTAYLKYHYPVEFLCSMFNQKDITEYEPILADCNDYNVDLVAPDINKSYFDFTISNHSIIYGFKGIKGIASNDIISKIVTGRERLSNGYTSMKEFMLCNTEDNSFQINKGIMKSLIYSGSFNSILPNREQANETYQFYKEIFTNKKSYEEIENKVRDLNFPATIMETDLHSNYNNDIFYMGGIISETPLKQYQEDSYYDCMKINSLTNDSAAKVMGFIVSIKEGTTKNGYKKIELELQGHTGKLKVYLTNKQYLQHKTTIYDMLNKVVKVEGEYKYNILFAKTIELLNESIATYFVVCDNVDIFEKISRNIKENPGKEVILIIENYINKNLEVSNTPVVTAFYTSLRVAKNIKAIREQDFGTSM